ncbi:hypothetical protein Barb6XT_02368 [Bacteroidales bacterium Barb6XT]|nr:hypothetical protein Barb6XT_02368 [Bacteroidales bacterium Barb6XT]
MKKIYAGMFLFLACLSAEAQESDGKFKPTFNAGVLLHTYVSAQQNGFGSPAASSSADTWGLSANLYRARLMTEAHLSKNDYVFIETELTASVGTGSDKAAGIKILDAQYDHTFGSALTVSAGKMLVSHNRNGLQTASTLMVNDFTYFQYPHNMSAGSPLQNDLGRDVGVNLSGGFFASKLAYRLGAFAGKRDFNEDAQAIRITGRAGYNFLDADKYAGTNLGEGKTFTVAGGFDTQGTYLAAGTDAYLDYPLGSTGSLTLNAAWSYISGGNDLAAKYSFAGLIPTQNTQLLELGYYFKSVKLQPWIRYERQDFNSEDRQTGGTATADFDKLGSTTVLGGGLNYFFNDYKTNLKLSYVAMTKGISEGSGITNKTYGQVWLQLQLCLF